MKKLKTDRIIYSVNVADLQEVSQEILERPLTEEEIERVEPSVGNYIDWFQAVENAIRANVHERNPVNSGQTEKYQ